MGLNTKRPYVNNSTYSMIPARGGNFYLSTGIYTNFLILHIQFQPEFVSSQNLPYQRFPDTYSDWVTASRYLFWNVGDSPERFGQNPYSKLF